jgi:hypothetical protein
MVSLHRRGVWVSKDIEWALIADLIYPLFGL